MYLITLVSAFVAIVVIIEIVRSYFERRSILRLFCSFFAGVDIAFKIIEIFKKAGFKDYDGEDVVASYIAYMKNNLITTSCEAFAFYYMNLKGHSYDASIFE